MNSDLSEGLARYNAGRFQEAARFFRRALRGPRPEPEAYCFLAHALESSGRAVQAGKIFAAAVRRFPSFLRARLDWAAMMRRQGRRREEESLLRKAVRLAPADREVRERLARALREKAALYSAWGTPGTGAADRRREKLDALRRKALEHKKAGRRGPERACCRAILKEEPGHLESWLGLIDGSMSGGKRAPGHEVDGLVRALGAAKGALEPALAESLLQAAVRLDRLGSAGGARLAEALVRRNPGHAQARGLSARILLREGKYSRARKHAERLLRLRPAEGEGWRVRGAARLLAGSPRSALADLSKAVARDPSDLESVLWRGEARLALKDWAGAYRDYERAVSGWGESLVPYVGLSLSLLGRGREPGAVITEITDSLWPSGVPKPAGRGGRAAALRNVLRRLKGDRSRFPGAGNLWQAARQARRGRQLRGRIGELERSLRDFEAFADGLSKGGGR